MKKDIKFIGLVLICLVAISCSSPEDMVLVPGGTFQMGDIFGDGKEKERPVHPVTLHPFYVSRYEVTVGEFREFITATGYRTTAEKERNAKVWVAGVGVVDDSTGYWERVGYEQSETHPVVLISWDDAINYCNWRSKKEGLHPCYTLKNDSSRWDFNANGYRLLTEAEWEYVARSGGKDYKYAWGNGEPYIDGKPAGNIRDLTLGEASSMKGIWPDYRDGFIYAAPVGSFQPNELGIYDLGGNVYEWCWDWFDEQYYTISPPDNPTGPVRGESHACRDVGFLCHQPNVRVLSRGLGLPNLCFSWGGFRLARSVAGKSGDQ